MVSYVSQLELAKSAEEEAKAAELIRMNAKAAGLGIWFMDDHGGIVSQADFYSLAERNPEAPRQILFIVGHPVRKVASRRFISNETLKYLLRPE